MCDSLVCRCEEVTEQEIIAAIKDGATTQDAIKKLTRAGMGLCQGRTCRNLVARILASQLGLQMAEIRPFTYRAPVRPTTLGELANAIPCEPRCGQSKTVSTEHGVEGECDGEGSAVH